MKQCYVKNIKKPKVSITKGKKVITKSIQNIIGKKYKSMKK